MPYLYCEKHGRERAEDIIVDQVAYRHADKTVLMVSGALVSGSADNYNLNSRLGLVADLDGTAIVYADQADRLVCDGRFPTDVSLHQLASLLGVSPDSISNPRSPDEIGPDAELFRAQVGTLTEHSKEASREMRSGFARVGKPPDGVFTEWMVTNYSFTLNRLRHPNDDQAIVLSAIVHAAAETLPVPGEKVRAVGLNRGDLANDKIPLAPGFLPLETLEEASNELLARP